MSSMNSSLFICLPSSNVKRGSLGDVNWALEPAIAMIKPKISHLRFLPVKRVWNSDGRISEGIFIGRAEFLVISA